MAKGQVRAILGNGYRPGKLLSEIVYYSIERPTVVGSEAVSGLDELWLLPRVGVRR